jgi:hypothetical protein
MNLPTKFITLLLKKSLSSFDHALESADEFILKTSTKDQYEMFIAAESSRKFEEPISWRKNRRQSTRYIPTLHKIHSLLSSVLFLLPPNFE